MNTTTKRVKRTMVANVSERVCVFICGGREIIDLNGTWGNRGI